MSLYSLEEICRDCKHSTWHTCKDYYNKETHFCHCKINSEEYVDHLSGSCNVKESRSKS